MSFLLPPIVSWSDWTASHNDVHAWKPVVDAICDIEGIQYRRIELPIESTNAVFLLDRRMVVKIYSSFWPEFERETKLLQALQAIEEVPVPRIIAAGEYQDRVLWNYVIMEFCPGISLSDVWQRAPRQDQLAIAAQMGLVVRALHQTLTSCLDDVYTQRDWEDFVVHRRKSALTEFVNGGLLTARVAEELTDPLDEAIDASRRSQCVVVHGDLGGSGNFLLGGTDGKWRIDYLIDFGDARIGVRDYEWMPLWLGFFDRNAETMRAFIEAYDPSLLSDGDLPRRVMAWTFLHAYSEMPVAELLQRTGTPMPVQTLEELHRVLWPNLESLVS